MTLNKRRLLASLIAATFAAASAAVHAADLAAEEVLDMEVENLAGEELGEVEDLIVDLQSGKVRTVIIEHDRLLGLAEDLYAHPLSAFSATDDDDTLVLDTTREKLGEARGFSRDAWPGFDDPYWAMYSPQPGGLPVPAGGIRFPGGMQENASTGASAASPELARASELIEAEVKHANGEELGEVEALVFDARTGEAHLVIDLEDSLREARMPLASFTMRDGELVRRE